MKVLTGTQMSNIDKRAITELNIDGLILMETAGLKVFQKIQEIIKDWDKSEQTTFKNIVVVAGKGNNGGDGFVIARHLIQAGIPTTVYGTTEYLNLYGETLKNYQALENFGDINIITDETLEDLRDNIIESSIVVDALFGTGFKGTVEDIYEEIIEIINESDGIIISVDIPSGVEADTGKVLNIAVEADYTITFAAPKLGLLLFPGADYAGEVETVDISIPEILIATTDSNTYLTDDDYVFNTMPWRPENSNKGTYGKTLTIAGCQSMTGAGLLSAISILKSGAGTSTLASPSSVVPYLTGSYPEITFLPLKENALKTLCAESATELDDKLDNYQSILIGPGLSINKDIIEFLDIIISKLLETEIPVLIDADGLNCLSKLSGIKLTENFILTPHPRELSRLLKVEKEEILEDRLKYAQLAAKKYNCCVILKGAKSIIATEECAYINPTGNSGLATAGTGDVLSGIITSLMVQGLTTFEAGICGTYIHGLAADIAVNDKTEFSLLATDVINYIPEALKKLGFL
jgi:NAD(P)H-hydrate epimerase